MDGKATEVFDCIRVTKRCLTRLAIPKVYQLKRLGIVHFGDTGKGKKKTDRRLGPRKSIVDSCRSTQSIHMVIGCVVDFLLQVV